MMAMWTIGYSAADALAVAQTTTDQHGSNWVSRAMWVVMLASLFAYGGWQAYLCYQSYQQPAWAYNVDHPTTIRYPAVLVCPLGYKNPHNLMTENATCSFGIDMGGGNYAISSCDINIVFVEQGKGPAAVCILVNNAIDDNSTTFARTDARSYMEVDILVNKSPFKGSGAEPKVELYPVQVSLFTQGSVPPTKYRTLVHNFVGMPGESFWSLITKYQDVYLNGRVVDNYDVSVSSTRGSVGEEFSATFSFSSFDISQSTEYVYFDWLSLLGVLGGASSLAMAGHLLSMLLYEKVLYKIYEWVHNKLWPDIMVMPINPADDDETGRLVTLVSDREGRKPNYT